MRKGGSLYQRLRPRKTESQPAEPREFGKRAGLLVGWVLAAAGIFVPAWSSFYTSINANKVAERNAAVAEGELQIARESAQRDATKAILKFGEGPEGTGGNRPEIVKDPNDDNRAFVVIDGLLFELKDPRGLPEQQPPDLPIISGNLSPMYATVDNPVETPIWPFVAGGVITGIGAVVIGVAATRRRPSASTTSDSPETPTDTSELET